MSNQPQVLTFPATHEGFETAFADLREWLDGSAVGTKAHFNAELVFEEIVTNIVRYGYAGGGDEPVAVELQQGPGSITMTFDDGGEPFDPTGKSDPELPKSIEEAKIGGLGLMLVRKAASDLSYERTDEGRNRFSVTIPAE